MIRLACTASVFFVIVASIGCKTVEPFQAHRDLARTAAAEDLPCKEDVSTSVVESNDRGAGKDRVREAKVVAEGCGLKATYGVQCVADGDSCTKTSAELPSSTPTTVVPEPVAPNPVDPANPASPPPSN